MIAIGDSKTVGSICCEGTGYRPALVTGLVASPSFDSASFVGVLATGGKTTAQTLADLPAFLSAQTVGTNVVLINLGTNDLPGIRTEAINEASWTADMGGILDALHAKFPAAKLYLMRVYRSDHTAEQDELDDTYIPAVLASRGDFAFLGPDERTFLPGNVSDTTHPTVTGYALTAAAWQTAMGY